MTKPVTVLVVDDEESVTRYIRRTLEGVGCETHVAEDGWSGLERVMELKPDVVILDVKMPILQGDDVCRNIKSEPDMKSVKVLMMSGGEETSIRESVRRLGADGFLPKPFDRDTLIHKVSDLAPRS